MSLVIVGYDNEQFYDSKIDDGIFAISDSAITINQGQSTLLNGFRKVYELEAKIWKPHFYPDGSFNKYIEIYNKCSLLIGFVGSTLVAQHILNSITGHIEKLRISYIEDTSPIEYQIIPPCESNPMNSEIYTMWDDGTFLDSDFSDLTKGETIASVIEHSINHALKSATQYRLSMEEFKAMSVDIVCGIWCPYKREHEIYIYRMKSKRGDDGVLFAYTEKELLPKDKVVVLGMRNQFDGRAQSNYNAALSQNIKPSDKLVEFLNECIDEVQKSGSKEIDKPISFRKLKQNNIEKII